MDEEPPKGNYRNAKEGKKVEMKEWKVDAALTPRDVSDDGETR